MSEPALNCVWYGTEPGLVTCMSIGQMLNAFSSSCLFRYVMLQPMVAYRQSQFSSYHTL